MSERFTTANRLGHGLKDGERVVLNDGTERYVHNATEHEFVGKRHRLGWTLRSRAVRRRKR